MTKPDIQRLIAQAKEKKDNYISDFRIFEKNCSFQIVLESGAVIDLKSNSANTKTYTLSNKSGLKLKKPITLYNRIGNENTEYEIKKEITLIELSRMASVLTNMKNVCFFNDDNYFIYNGQDIKHIQIKNNTNQDIVNDILQGLVFGDDILILPFFTLIKIINDKNQSLFIRKKILLPGAVSIGVIGSLILYIKTPENQQPDLTKHNTINEVVVEKDSAVYYKKNIDLYKENKLLSAVLKTKNPYDLLEAFKSVKEIHIDSNTYSYVMEDLLTSQPISTITINVDKSKRKDILHDSELAEYFTLGIDPLLNQSLIENLKIKEMTYFTKDEENIKHKIKEYLMTNMGFDSELTLIESEVNNEVLFEILTFIKVNNIFISNAIIKKSEDSNNSSYIIEYLSLSI